MSKQIYIYSPKSTPFGLLSNNAITPIDVDGKAWESVTNYVYTNLLDSDEYKSKIRDRLYRNPFSRALEIMTEIDERIFNKAITFGSHVKLLQYPGIMSTLMQTTAKDLEFANSSYSPELTRMVIGVYNDVRFDKTVYFDPVRGLISKREIADVIAGLEIELRKNKDLENMTFEEAHRYAIKSDIPSITDGVTDLDHLVDDVRQRIGKELYETEMEAFKTSLLDAHLDFILKTDYPQIPFTRYNVAKYQQRQIYESEISAFKTRLFDMYVNENVSPDILSTIPYIPKRAHVLAYVGKSPVTQRPIRPELVDSIYTIVADDPLAIEFPQPVTIDDMQFRTIIHYAYWILFKNIGGIDFNVNDVSSIHELKNIYLDRNRNYILDKITINNQRATDAKFQRYSDIRQLLVETDKNELIWGDKDDQILGIGTNNTGGNRTGQYLTFYRDMRASVSTNTMPKDLSSLIGVFIIKWYLSNLCEDFANTLILLQNPTPNAIIEIYDLKPTNVTNVTDLPFAFNPFIMNRSGLNREQSTLIVPFIVTELDEFLGISERECVHRITNKYDESQPSDDRRRRAEDALRRIYGSLNATRSDETSVDEDTFVASILANKPTTDKTAAIWWRINKWAKRLAHSD